MTTNDTAVIENSYQDAEAKLSEAGEENPILNIKRFSALGVLFLSVFTYLIYTFYWMYSRSKMLNELSSVNKISMPLVYSYIFIGIVSYVYPFVMSELMWVFWPPAIPVLIGLSIIGFLLTIILIFSMKIVLTEVLNAGSVDTVKLGGIKTLFFNIVFFQYKINQAIDIAKDRY